MGATQEIITTKEKQRQHDTRRKKRKDTSMIFYLKANRYYPEGLKPQEANINIP